MSRVLGYLAGHKRGVALSLVLLVVGACFRWEKAEIDDARTGERIASHHRAVFPWQPCLAALPRERSGRLINFHVRHWLCYGLIKVEAKGQTMW
jgi:hypothetical protein